MKTTDYFTYSVLARPYLKTEWLEFVINSPAQSELQRNGRIRHWAFIKEEGKFLRVIVESDGETVRNAFFDRGFKI